MRKIEFYSCWDGASYEKALSTTYHSCDELWKKHYLDTTSLFVVVTVWVARGGPSPSFLRSSVRTKIRMGDSNVISTRRTRVVSLWDYSRAFCVPSYHASAYETVSTSVLGECQGLNYKGICPPWRQWLSEAALVDQSNSPWRICSDISTQMWHFWDSSVVPLLSMSATFWWSKICQLLRQVAFQCSFHKICWSWSLRPIQKFPSVDCESFLFILCSG